MVMIAVLLCLPAPPADADLILHNGKIVTVGAAFRVVEAIAIKVGRITATGTSTEILAAERSSRTKVVDLAGKTVLPGLIDAHVHALEAGLSEFRAPLPVLDSIAAIQDYIRTAARSRAKGAWIVVPRTLPPRL
uniref:Amidohydrolase 3 domain-containing protein n=1 Tax=Solibacter usitatus (strain Ellin6076) TaxID=234267 RepID=Q01TJ6_SOLUE